MPAIWRKLVRCLRGSVKGLNEIGQLLEEDWETEKNSPEKEIIAGKLREFEKAQNSERWKVKKWKCGMGVYIDPPSEAERLSLNVPSWKAWNRQAHNWPWKTSQTRVSACESVTKEKSDWALHATRRAQIDLITPELYKNANRPDSSYPDLIMTWAVISNVSVFKDVWISNFWKKKLNFKFPSIF